MRRRACPLKIFVELAKGFGAEAGGAVLFISGVNCWSIWQLTRHIAETTGVFFSDKWWLKMNRWLLLVQWNFPNSAPHVPLHPHIYSGSSPTLWRIWRICRGFPYHYTPWAPHTSLICTRCLWVPTEGEGCRGESRRESFVVQARNNFTYTITSLDAGQVGIATPHDASFISRLISWSSPINSGDYSSVGV